MIELQSKDGREHRGIGKNSQVSLFFHIPSNTPRFLGVTATHGFPQNQGLDLCINGRADHILPRTQTLGGAVRVVWTGPAIFAVELLAIVPAKSAGEGDGCYCKSKRHDENTQRQEQ
jgi:hypothetical protein